MEGWDLLTLGLIQRIGTGADMRIWEDNWLPRDYKLKPICPISANPPTYVSAWTRDGISTDILYKEQNEDHVKKPTVTLEEVALQDMWI